MIDRARFPRDKVCGGWLTPDVFRLLELAPGDDRDAGLTLQEITGFRTAVLGRPSVDTPYPRIVSYAIRRCEFDDFLLRRTDARVLEQTALTSLRHDTSTSSCRFSKAAARHLEHPNSTDADMRISPLA